MMRFTTGLAAAFVTLSAAAALAAPATFGDSAKGKILVDAKGMALYTYDKDEAGKTNCIGPCLTNWPALMAAATDKAEGDWTIVDRPEGTKMWAYKGKPVYFYVKDTKAGDLTGDGVGGSWHLIVQ